MRVCQICGIYFVELPDFAMQAAREIHATSKEAERAERQRAAPK